jgi:hypothetical protein
MHTTPSILLTLEEINCYIPAAGGISCDLSRV